MDKKKIIIIISSIVGIILGIVLIFYGVKYYRIKTAKIEVVLNQELEVEFNDKRKISSFIEHINGKIINDRYIDTKSLGKKEITFNFINDDNIKVTYTFNVDVVDKTPPLIWLGSSYSAVRGKDIDLAGSIMCGDNYDSKPNCYVEGEYDLNTVGSYPLVYNAIDSSNNHTTQKFTLNVYEPKRGSSGGGGSTPGKRIYFTDVVKEHKTDKTSIGIDISKWQGEVDFKKLKEAGVEFVFIRVGSTKGIEGDYFIDPYFERNIKEANKYGIDVGIYFYTYANSISKAKKDAKWVIKQIKDYDVSLPVAYDFEDWGSFNEYKVSFYELTEIAKSFMKEIEKAGYESMLYSSKSYLEKVWLDTGRDTWLAHYTSKTNYEGKYKLWQLCNNGAVDGINGNVDIDIMYK